MPGKFLSELRQELVSGQLVVTGDLGPGENRLIERQHVRVPVVLRIRAAAADLQAQRVVEAQILFVKAAAEAADLEAAGFFTPRLILLIFPEDPTVHGASVPLAVLTPVSTAWTLGAFSCPFDSLGAATISGYVAFLVTVVANTIFFPISSIATIPFALPFSRLGPILWLAAKRI